MDLIGSVTCVEAWKRFDGVLQVIITEINHCGLKQKPRILETGGETSS